MLNILLVFVQQHAAQCIMTSTPVKTVRLSVPVTPEVRAIFQRLAEASGRSMAASLGQWLNDTKDAAQAMAENLERLRGAHGDLVMKVRLHAGSVEDMAEMLIHEANNRFDSDLDVAAWPAGVPAQRARGPVAQPLTPPSSNTGGKVHRRGKSDV